MKRQVYLDNLKLFLTLLVIFHHAAQPHMPGSYWPYHFSDDSMLLPGIWHFLSTNASFFMGLFFLIAGYFVPRSYDKQGPARFAGKKLVHLGIPSVLMTALISICLVHRFEIAHMWFLENLLFFSLLYIIFRLLFPAPFSFAKKGPSIWLLLAVALGMGAIVQIVRHFYAQDYWVGLGRILFFEPARYGQYVIMFVLGLFASRCDFFERMDKRTGLTCLVAGGLLAIGNYLRAGGPWDHFVGTCFGFYESIMSISISFGLIWLFREGLNRSNRFVSWCCAQTMWVYIVHLPLMVCLQFAFDGLLMPPIQKFFFIGTLSTVVSFFVAGLITFTATAPVFSLPYNR